MQGSRLPNEGIALLIAAVRRRMKQVVWNRLVPFNLTPQQFWVLLHLYQQDGMSLHELAQQVWADDPTACRIIARLSERKLVRTENDPSDRRRFRLMLTPRGRKLSGELLGLAADLKQGLERGLSPAERDTVCALLQRIVDNIEQMAAEPAAPARKRARS